MEQTEFVYTKIEDVSLEMQTQEARNMVSLHGKALLNEHEKRFIFLQNKPRGARSVEVSRWQHSRLVRRPDGDYTLTLRFNAQEKYLNEKLIGELRNVVKSAKEDHETIKIKEKKK